MEEGLGRRSLRGGAMLIIARSVNAIVQIGTLIILARLLSPEDYGLTAMVTALTGFGPVLVDLGTRDAVVQRASITQGEVSTLFWLTAGVGATFTLMIFLAGPLIAGFYNEPRLTGIVQVSSLTFVAIGLTAQHEALIRRAGMFRELAIVGTVASVLSAAVAIVMAYFGLGYWTLVTRPVVMYSLTAAGIWWYCRWLPRKPALTPGVKPMVKFGLNLSGFTVTDFIGRNSDRVVIGRGLGARVLGYYQNSFLIYENLLDVLVVSVHQVAVSSLSKLQHDLAELRRAWGKALSTISFYTMPAFGLLAVVSADLIVLVLGPKWAPSGALLSVLALRGIPHSAERTLGWLHVASGRTDRWFRWGLLTTSIQLIAVLSAIPFGAFGIAWAQVLMMYTLFVPTLAYAGRPLGIGAREVIGVTRAPLISAVCAAGVGFLVRASLPAGMPSVERIPVLALTYLAVYLAIVVGAFRLTTPLQVGLSLLKDLRPRSQALVVNPTAPGAHE